jgi:glycosylphosphatidylinositol transamidase (GPIT) subunit GPI8
MSHGYDILLNSPKSDDFTFYFDQLLKDISIKNSKITLKQLANYMDISKLKVHSKLVSLSKQLPNSQLSNWITRTDKIQSKSSKIKWKKV